MRTRACLGAALAAALAVLPLERASAQVGPMPSTIRVTATGEARANPDRAWADFGVETTGATAAAAATENARRMTQIIAALQRAGVPREDIETRDYSVYPNYVPPPNGQGEPVLRGYRVSNTVTARTDRVASVGSLIDAALGAGANRVNGVRFGLKSPETLRTQALRQAMERGRAEAEVIATGLGVRLGRIVDASTSSEPPRPMPVMMMDAAMMSRAGAAPPTPIEAGEQTVAATIWLTYAIVQ
jgi:uncharacterized protein YggE